MSVPEVLGLRVRGGIDELSSFTSVISHFSLLPRVGEKSITTIPRFEGPKKYFHNSGRLEATDPDKG